MSVRELHKKAMDLAQLAMVARHNSEWEKVGNLTSEAYKYEWQAAEQIPETPESEPTRSILYRSAASLAYQAKEYDVSLRLIAKGLSGYPPPQVLQELKDLYEQVNYESHLQTRGITLANEDLQLSLHGQSVGSGNILFDEFINRIKTVRLLVDRTIQRLMGVPYQRSGRVAKNYRPFLPTLSTPRPGSFSITLKLAWEDSYQMSLFTKPESIKPEFIIGEIISNIELVNNSQDKLLKERIQDESYYRNFLALTKDIAPDGKKINFVGFTSNTNAVALTRPKENIEFEPATNQQTEQIYTPIVVHGILDYANARHQETIGLTTSEGQQYTVQVKEGLDDVVRAYFKQMVVVSGYSDGKLIKPTDIQPSED